MIAIYFYQVFLYGGQSLRTVFLSHLSKPKLWFLPLIKLKNVITVVWLDGYTQKLFERRHIFQLAPLKLISNPTGLDGEEGGTMPALSSILQGTFQSIVANSQNLFTNTDTFLCLHSQYGHTGSCFFVLCQLFLPVKHHYFSNSCGFFPSGAHSYLPTRAKWMLLITFLFMREFQKKKNAKWWWM